MPSLESFKKETDKLITDIQVFKTQPNLVNPYKVINGISELISVATTIILPQTQTLKLISWGMKLFSAFLNGYSKEKVNDG